MWQMRCCVDMHILLKWLFFQHLLQVLLYARHLSCPPWCGQSLPQLQHFLLPAFPGGLTEYVLGFEGLPCICLHLGHWNERCGWSWTRLTLFFVALSILLACSSVVSSVHAYSKSFTRVIDGSLSPFWRALWDLHPDMSCNFISLSARECACCGNLL